MKNYHTISAVILAAGLSERMGCFKPLMKLGDQKVIDRVISLYRSVGVSDICVVAGHRAAEMTAALAGSGVRIALNQNYQKGMYSSVLVGVWHLPSHCRAFFIHPVDIPLVRVPTVLALLRVFHEEAGNIVYPLFTGRRGHPPLIATRLAPEILKWPGTGGLRAFLERNEKRAMDVPVVDEAVLLDLDTPEDRHHFSARLKNEDIPTPVECRMLMERICALPERILAHCRAVAAIAEALTRELNHAGLGMNIDLVYSAALLHDIARAEEPHAQMGADLLEKWGFPRLADIVRVQMDIAVDETRPISEAEIVYLADKLVSGNRRVDLAQRFRKKMRLHEKDPQAVAAIQVRLDNAQRIQVKIERMTGRSLKRILDSGHSYGDN